MDGFFTSKNGSLSDFVHEKEKPLLLYAEMGLTEVSGVLSCFIHPILISGPKDFPAQVPTRAKSEQDLPNLLHLDSNQGFWVSLGVNLAEGSILTMRPQGLQEHSEKQP